MRRKMFRILNLPFFLIGIYWWHVNDAFKTGMAWESEEMKKVK